MKFIFRALAVLLLIQTCLVSCNVQNKKLNTIEFTQKWDSLRVLKNPHKGWYHHLLDNGISKYQITDDSLFYSFPGMDHLYLRLAWSYLEPEEGIFDWHYIDDVVEKYVPSGYGISFRITCKETGTWPGSAGQQQNGVMYATPVWVEKAGAKGTVTEAWGTRSWTPKWDDQVFLEKLDNFHRRFAERYDGKPWVRYVDIGSIGEWGEGHTSFSTKVPPTPDEVIAHADLHLKHYKNSQLVVTDDLLYYGKPKEDQLRLLEAVISTGITLRDDSPMVEWYLQQNAETWSVSHPHFYDPLYLTKPIIFELQHYHMVKRDGNWKGPNGSEVLPSLGYSAAEIMKNAIETMRATYIGYHGYAEEWLSDNPELTKELANLCGYWYFPASVTFPKKLKSGINTIEMEWLNKGIAPAYHTFALIFRFTSSIDGHTFDVVIEDSGNRNWLPGKKRKEQYIPDLPSAFQKGEYSVKFKLLDRSTDPQHEVKVGLKETLIDGEGFALIGQVTLQS